jgi:hypothetical protein
MNQQKQIQLPKSLFLQFLDANAKINNSFVLQLGKNAYTIIGSENNTLFLLSQFNIKNIEFEEKLNIADCRKLARAIENINKEDITLTIQKNCLLYKDNTFKFKYHLLENGFIGEPAINISKINNFEFDIQFCLSKEIIQTLFKYSSFASTTNKIYLYTDNNALYAELTDRASSNVDSITLKLKDVDFNLSPIIVNFENLRFLSLISNNVDFKINTNYGVLIIEINTEDLHLKYIITSLTQ